MQVPSMEQAFFTVPPPTQEEFSTLMELRHENVHLLEARKCYLGLLDVLCSDLEQSFSTSEQLRKENACLRAELLCLGASQGFVASDKQGTEHIPCEEGRNSIKDFLLYLLSRARSSNSDGFVEEDLPPQFPCLTRFSDSQPHVGEDVFDLETGIKNCGFPWSILNMQPAAPNFELGGSTGTFNPGTADSSCSTSQSCGYYASGQPVAMVNNPQNLVPHATEVPIQRHVPWPASTLPVFSEMPPKLTSPAGKLPGEGFTHTTSHADAGMQQHGAQYTSASEHMVPGDSFQDQTAKDSRSLKVAGCSLPPIENAVEAHKLLSPTNLQQETSDKPNSCPPAHVAVVSQFPAASERSWGHSEPMIESNFQSGEYLSSLQSDQPTGATSELNSTASSTAVVSNPLPHGFTTLVVRNVPARYTKVMLMKEWPPDGTYDLLYLPFNFKQKRGAGFAFVNFTSHEAAVSFYRQWHGKSLRDQGTAKLLSIVVSEAQGLEENLRHLASSNVGRIKNPKFLPSVFSGIEEVPLAGLLDQLEVSDADCSTGDTGDRNVMQSGPIDFEHGA